MRRIEAVRCKPALHFLAACNAILDLPQGHDARFKRSDLLSSIYRRVLRAQNLFQPSDALPLRFKAVAFLATLGIKFRSALSQELELSRIGYDQYRIFLP